ncbi:hypothetical protein [Alkaliphilus metalliredigens]|nr:hypothetical protein [Alkaliphilus metalliredigens]
MSAILDILFEILEVPLKKWDKLKLIHKVIFSVFLGLVLFGILTNV